MAKSENSDARLDAYTGSFGSVSSMSDLQRDEAISAIESRRAEVVADIERTVREISRLTRRPHLRRRRYKLGRSPNDYCSQENKRRS